MDGPTRLTRDVVRIILVAALVTAPIFLFAEGADATHAWRVAASNGVCIALCAGLLVWIRQGRARLAARVLVFGLLALVGTLASTNGEPVHVNVINFVLVTVLASALLPRGELVVAGLVGALVLVAIAAQRATTSGGGDRLEAIFEPVAQFLPTYLVILFVLWRRDARAGEAMER